MDKFLEDKNGEKIETEAEAANELISGGAVAAGGVHNLAWQNCGIDDEPVAVEKAVHLLEHEADWITYQPDMAEEVEQLCDLVTLLEG